MKKQVAKGSLQLHHLELSNRKTTGSEWDRDRMKRFIRIASIIAACFTLTALASAAEDGAMAPAAPVLPGIGPGGLPALPELPAALPPSAPAAQPGAIPSLEVLNQPAQPAAAAPSSAIAGLQPLTAGLDSISTAPEASAAPSGSGVAVALNAFLFRDDQNFEKVMRNRMSSEEAEKAKQNEIEILRNRRQTQGQQPGGAPMIAQDPYASPYGGQVNQQQGAADSMLAAAEFDFYYQQLELYDRYLREQVLSDLDEEDMPDEPTYEASNYLQEGVTLQDAFNKAGLTQVTKQQEENLQFMERLNKRKDRREAFANWVLEKRQELDQWTLTWTNNVNGSRWIGGDTAVRLNDWYYGINFNSPQPINFSVEDNKFLLSRTPQRDVPEDTLNIISTNLTPFDIISKDGYVKDVSTERLKGTAVRAPREAPREGTIEIAD
ncbi:hypothetical protein CVU37_12535 [candidate division BRC1 bacterium HGW-BRC1-1]|jgi:hypothetical protein|nr:MAG: hypothetical protein CVU37_12535 [candidate division BRC1 bacterium HGW-BRC1-1]